MNGAAIRRVAVLVAGWAVLAWLVLGAAVWLERTLALPPLFRTSLVGLLLLGLGLGVPLAWRLPDVGRDPPDGEAREPGDGPG